MVVEAGFTSASVCRIVGISRRQVQYWDETGLVKPSARPASGRGSRRLYSFDDLVRLSVVRMLIERGVTPGGIRRALASLRDFDDSGLEGQKLLTDGDGLFLLTDDPGQILDVLDRQAAFSLALGPVVRSLRVAAGERPPADAGERRLDA